MKLFLAFLLIANTAWASTLKEVPGGRYRPLLGKGKKVKVTKYYISETPVTNAEYLDFVKAHSEWRKSTAKKLFVDTQYLNQWEADLELGEKVQSKAPVTHVSWFAAQAYCESLGLNLPTIDQWEYIAKFGPENQKNDTKTVILEWYSKPTPELVPEVKSTFKNQYGVWDVHGLIWEWSLDFNTTFVTGESRGDSSLEKAMFCGSGAVGSADPSDYAAFMRFGFRSSLKANYTLANLGFRCAKGGPL